MGSQAGWVRIRLSPFSKLCSACAGKVLLVSDIFAARGLALAKVQRRLLQSSLNLL